MIFEDERPEDEQLRTRKEALPCKSSQSHTPPASKAERKRGLSGL